MDEQRKYAILFAATILGGAETLVLLYRMGSTCMLG